MTKRVAASDERPVKRLCLNEPSALCPHLDFHNLPFGRVLPIEIQDRILERKHWMEWKERISKVNKIFAVHRHTCVLTGLVCSWMENGGVKGLTSILVLDEDKRCTWCRGIRKFCLSVEGIVFTYQAVRTLPVPPPLMRKLNTALMRAVIPYYGPTWSGEDLGGAPVPTKPLDERHVHEWDLIYYYQNKKKQFKEGWNAYVLEDPGHPKIEELRPLALPDHKILY